MAVQSLVLIHPRELEKPNIQNFATTQENTTAEDLPFAKEKPAVGDDAIMMEKPGPGDSDTLEKDDMEKAEMADDTTPEKATTEVAADTTQEDSTEMAEMAAQEDSTEMAADSTPEEGSQEKAELAADKDFELVVAEALKKVDLNLSA